MLENTESAIKIDNPEKLATSVTQETIRRQKQKKTKKTKTKTKQNKTHNTICV